MAELVIVSEYFRSNPVAFTSGYDLLTCLVMFNSRTFTYRHLAQLKFLLPEAIEIKRTLVNNERLCVWSKIFKLL